MSAEIQVTVDASELLAAIHNARKKLEEAQAALKHLETIPIRIAQK
jgi:hypothetical protein